MAIGKGSILATLILLFAGQALCDFPFQGHFLSDAKNHRRPNAGEHWARALFAHAMIHCGMVHLGFHASAEEAARAHDSKSSELRGEFAVLNFPV